MKFVVPGRPVPAIGEDAKPTIHSESDLDKARAMARVLMSDSDELRYLVIEGEPQSKMRPRFGKKTAYKSKKQRENEEYLAWHFKKSFEQPYTENVAIGCIFYRSNKQRIDVDNLLKNVMDAATGIVWIDDCQVTAQMGILEYDKERPRTVVIIGKHKTTMTRNLDTKQICQACGKEFEVSSPYWRGRRKFCSPECAAKAQAERRKGKAICLHCGKEFHRKTGGQKYCSKKCALEHLNQKRKHETTRKQSYCRYCGKPVSRPEYTRCRDCWRKEIRGEL